MIFAERRNKIFGMKKDVDLSPLTVGQFKRGDPYNGGTVVEVSTTKIVVDFPDEPRDVSSDELIKFTAKKLGIQTYPM